MVAANVGFRALSADPLIVCSVDESHVIWAKTLEPDGTYPLLAHLLDSAAFAKVLWEQWLSDPLRDRLSVVFGPEAGGVIAWLAGCHDLGKCEPMFQGQLLLPSRFQRPDLLAGSGLSVPAEDVVSDLTDRSGGGELRPHTRHEAVSAALLERLGIPQWVCVILSGHHGRFPVFDGDPLVEEVVQQYRDDLVSGEFADWGHEAARLVGTIAAICSVNPADLPKDVSAEWIALLTGVVVTADWLASDEKFIARSPIHLLYDPGAYLVARVVQAHKVIEEVLGIPARPQGDFTDLFGFAPSRPAQQLAVNQHASGLSIVAVPMGEGKTEVALWQYAAASTRDGLVFALPTTATADSMFARVQKFFHGTPSLASLAHGKAMFNAFYNESSMSPVGVCDDSGGLDASAWAQNRYRALSAPVVVGTCDQVLAAAVSHKYSPVRLAHLASKHVVLDEVHTYDPYQHVLLTRLLRYLGRYGTRVTLLSATLPESRTRDYVRAYTGSDQDVDVQYPAMTFADPEVVSVHRLPAFRSYTHRLVLVDIQRDLTSAAAADIAVSHLQSGSLRVGVVLNTVDRAIQTARLLSERTDVEVVCLHSRMTLLQRAAAVKKVMSLVGKDAPLSRCIVVSTPLLEASFDIDFDLLVTELAPASSLVQRMGRQWRHSSPTSSGWQHPSHLAHRREDPLMVVLVPVDASGGLNRWSCLPYTRAELFKTWQGLRNLPAAGLVIPAGVQALVDRAEVTFEEVSAGDVPDAAAHVVSALTKGQAAARIGVDVEDLVSGWAVSGQWEYCGQFATLTRGALWVDDSATRMRDTITATVVFLDPDGEHPRTFHGDVDDVLASRTPSEQEAVLERAIPVSGRLASDLRALSCNPADWVKTCPPLLRDVTLIAASDAQGTVSLGDLGLERTPGGT